MIIDQNIHPERDLYYLGSRLIKHLLSSEESILDYLELYTSFRQENDISLSLFSLTLDWLFLLGLVKKFEKGGIVKCF